MFYCFLCISLYILIFICVCCLSLGTQKPCKTFDLHPPRHHSGPLLGATFSPEDRKDIENIVFSMVLKAGGLLWKAKIKLEEKSVH